MSKQLEPKYFFPPTLLDAFWNFLNAESSWEKYYGHSEDPKISLADYEQAEYEALIVRINREGTDIIEAAECGTAFNDLVDTLLNNEQCGRTKFSRICDDEGNVIGVTAKTENFEFHFDYKFAMDAAIYFGKRIKCVDGYVLNPNPSDTCLNQVLVESTIDTIYGVVDLYGYIDEMRRDWVYDIKTTRKYEFGKYSNYNQRYVYPYCLIESGMSEEINFFEFTAYQLKGGDEKCPLITGTKFSEVYNYNHEDAKRHIKEICERFIEFIEANRDKITDRNIFERHSHKH